MKKLHKLFITASLFLIAGCSENIEEGAPALPTQTLTVEASHVAVEPDSRAILDSQNQISKWESGDQIALYAASYATNGAQQATLTVSELAENDTKATFEGKGTQPADVDTYYAVYPATATVNATKAVFEIAATQSAVNTQKLMLVGQSVKDAPRGVVGLNFSATNAFLHFKGEGLKGLDNMTIEALGDAKLAGTYTYYFGDMPSVVLEDSSNTITVNGFTASTTEVFVAVPAVDLTQGLKITLNKGSEQMILSKTLSSPCVLGKVYPVAVNAFMPFSVDLSNIRTSYNFYKEVGAAEANTKDGSKIYLGDITIKGIASKFIENLKLTVAGTEIALTKKSADFGVVVYGVSTSSMTAAWQAHEAKLEVNGTTITKPLHVTGLPFIANPPKEDQGWSQRHQRGMWEVSWQSSYVQLSPISGKPHIVTPTFHIPEQTNITVATSAEVNAARVIIWYPTKMIVTIGGTEIINQDGGKQQGQRFSNSSNTTFTTSNKSIQVQASYNTPMSGQNVKLYSFTINYR